VVDTSVDAVGDSFDLGKFGHGFRVLRFAGWMGEREGGKCDWGITQMW
jgi:hypothetical protein